MKGYKQNEKNDHPLTSSEEHKESDTYLQDIYSEIGLFSGTSGAAPRVSGVFVILGQLLPELTMPEIRECVLSTGDPFWFDPNNRFTHLAKIAKEAGYDLQNQIPKTPQQVKDRQYLARIYGKGRINALKAYEKCSKIREEKRKKKTTITALDLHISADQE